MRSSSRNSVANNSSKPSAPQRFALDFSDRTRSHPHPDFFSQNPDNQLPSFFANFIKSPQSFGLTKETKQNEYFINTSFEEGCEPNTSPKAPYFLAEGTLSKKAKQQDINNNNRQSHEMPSRPEMSCTVQSPPKSFGHFNRFKGTVKSPEQNDFFDMPIDRKPPSIPRKATEQSGERDIRDSSQYDRSYHSVRPAESSKAYSDAMRKLQEQVKDLTEKTQNLETENEFLKRFQKEQVEQIKQEYHTKIDEYQCSSRYIQDGLSNLEIETMQLTQTKKELEEKIKAVSKENKKLKEDRSRLKKKVESLSGDNKFREETFEGMGKMLNDANERLKENAQEYKNKEEKLQSEISNFKKEKEELMSTNKNLVDKINKLEKDLTLNKKSYTQHIQQLSLTNEALKLDNNKLKGSYGNQLADFQTELESIHENYLKRINKFENTVSELAEENNKFKELIALKNKEIESLKMKAVQSQALQEIKLVQNHVAEDFFLKDSLFEKSKLSTKNSRHIETSLINKSTHSKHEPSSTIRHSPLQMRQYARRLLTDGEVSDRSSVPLSFNYTTASPEPVPKDRNEEAQEKLYSPQTKQNAMNTSIGNQVSTSESFYQNQRKNDENNRVDGHKNGSPNKYNSRLSRDDELSLSSIFTENNSFTRKEPAKSTFVVENFKDKILALKNNNNNDNNNKFGLSSEETMRGHINSKDSCFPSESDRNNTSREYMHTLKKFSKTQPSNFSFGEIPKSFRQNSIADSENKLSQRSPYLSPRI